MGVVMKNFNSFSNISFLSFLFLYLFMTGTAHLEASPFSGDDIEGEGIIQVIGSDTLGNDSLTVNNLIFYVDVNTEIKGEHGSSLSLSDLLVGDFVKVEADIMPNGKFLATKIEVENDNHFNEFVVEGYIDSLGADLVVVGGQEFSVTAQTETRGDHESRLTFADLNLSMFVEIKAISHSDGSFLSTKIKVEYDPNQFNTTGIMTGISSQSVYISNTSYQINANTVALDSSYQVMALNDLTLGKEVKVWVDNNNPADPIALQIKLEPLGKLTVIRAGQTEILPDDFELDQNYPNPFNPSTTIPLSIKGPAGQVRLTVYNVIGQKVKIVFNGVLQAGTYKFTWNGKNDNGQIVPSGVYFYEMFVGKNNSQMKRMLLIK
jgi:hypothetical protein